MHETPTARTASVKDDAPWRSCARVWVRLRRGWTSRVLPHGTHQEATCGCGSQFQRSLETLPSFPNAEWSVEFLGLGEGEVSVLRVRSAAHQSPRGVRSFLKMQIPWALLRTRKSGSFCLGALMSVCACVVYVCA